MILFRLLNLGLLNPSNPVHQQIELNLAGVALNLLRQSAMCITPYYPKWEKGELITYDESDEKKLIETKHLCENNDVHDFFIECLGDIIEKNKLLNDFINEKLKSGLLMELISNLVKDHDQFFSDYLSHGIFPTQLISNAIVFKKIHDKQIDIYKNGAWRDLSAQAFELWDKANEVTKRANESHFLHETFIAAFECLTYYVSIKFLLQLSIDAFKRENPTEDVPKDLWKEHQVVEEYRVWTFEIIAWSGGLYIERTVSFATLKYINEIGENNILNCFLSALKDNRTSFNIFPKILYEKFENIFFKYIGEVSFTENYARYFASMIENILTIEYYKTFQDQIVAKIAIQSPMLNYDVSNFEYILFLPPFNYNVSDSLRILMESLRLSQSCNDRYQTANWYSMLGLHYANLNNFILAKIFFETALNLYQKLEGKEEKVDLMQKRIIDMDTMQNDIYAANNG